MDILHFMTVIPDVGLHDPTFPFKNNKLKNLLLCVHSLPGTVLGAGISGREGINMILGLMEFGNTGGTRTKNNPKQVYSYKLR